MRTLFYIAFAFVLIYFLLFFSLREQKGDSSTIWLFVTSFAASFLGDTAMVFVKNLTVPIFQIVVIQWSCAVIVGPTDSEEVCGPQIQQSVKRFLSILIIIIMALLCWLIGSVSIESSPFSKSGVRGPIRNNFLEDFVMPFVSVVINTSGYQQYRPINLFLLSLFSIYLVHRNIQVPSSYDWHSKSHLFYTDTCFSWFYLFSTLTYVDTDNADRR